jgi:hypothetical protein
MVATDGTPIEEETGKSMDKGIDSSDTGRSESEAEYDIVRILKATDHYTCVYPNGIILGVHVDGIPNRRGVHVELAYVLDLRRATFGKATLAMQAAVLETLNRNLGFVLRDVEMSQRLIEVSKLTTKGRIRLSMLQPNSKHPGSLIYATRSVYVIADGARPSLDLSWLTETSRVLRVEDLLLARRSDMRSFLSEMQNRVLIDKWSLLGESIRKGWLGMLAIIFGAICGMALAADIFVNAGAPYIPIIAAAFGCIGGCYLLRLSRMRLTEFNKLLESEKAKVNRVGDGYRIDESMIKNEDNLRLQRDISFIVSPMMASVAGSIGIGDYDGAVASACIVLDECVRFSKQSIDSVGDEGLEKFVSLFLGIWSDIDEDALALAYVGLSNHLASPLSHDETIRHCTVLANALYDIGVLKPSVKDRIDDLMNQRALKENAKYLSTSETSDELPERRSTQTTPADDDWILDELSKEGTAPSDERDEIVEIVAETVPNPEVSRELANGVRTASELDSLSEIVQTETCSDRLEMRAVDVVNSAASLRTQHPATDNADQNTTGVNNSDKRK